MSPRSLIAVVAVAWASASNPAPAAFLAYDSSPTTNSADWAAEVASLGGVVNSAVNFDAHPTGALQPNFYASSAGVTFSSTGSPYTVAFGAGPSGTNTTNGPFSPGEGVHPASNYLANAGRTQSLTITFATPVFGAGLFVIDFFNPNAGNDLFLTAYAGPDGTGAPLGNGAASFGSFYNFQQNKRLFLGVVSTDGDIRSVTFDHHANPQFDLIGLDDLRFAPAAPAVATPLPPTALALLAGVTTLAGLARRRRAS